MELWRAALALLIGSVPTEVLTSCFCLGVEILSVAFSPRTSKSLATTSEHGT